MDTVEELMSKGINAQDVAKVMNVISMAHIGAKHFADQYAKSYSRSPEDITKSVVDAYRTAEAAYPKAKPPDMPTTSPINVTTPTQGRSIAESFAKAVGEFSKPKRPFKVEEPIHPVVFGVRPEIVQESAERELRRVRDVNAARAAQAELEQQSEQRALERERIEKLLELQEKQLAQQAAEQQSRHDLDRYRLELDRFKTDKAEYDAMRNTIISSILGGQEEEKRIAASMGANIANTLLKQPSETAATGAVAEEPDPYKELQATRVALDVLDRVARDPITGVLDPIKANAIIAEYPHLGRFVKGIVDAEATSRQEAMMANQQVVEPPSKSPVRAPGSPVNLPTRSKSPYNKSFSDLVFPIGTDYSKLPPTIHNAVKAYQDDFLKARTADHKAAVALAARRYLESVGVRSKGPTK